MNKDELRILFKKRRSELSPAKLTSGSLNIFEQCLSLDIWNKSHFHVFLSILEKAEVDTSSLITLLFKLNKQIAVPRILGKGKLEHIGLTSNSVLKLNKWGVPEPTEGLTVDPMILDVVFVPLLAFDLKGYRVGYGGGYYDNFLKVCRENVIRVGLSFFEPVDAITDIYSGDIPLDFAVTPTRIYRFNN